MEIDLQEFTSFMERYLELCIISVKTAVSQSEIVLLAQTETAGSHYFCTLVQVYDQ